MPPKNSILSQISKWASNAERNLKSPNNTDITSELRQRALSDFRLLKLIANRAVYNHKSRKGLNLLAGELASAVISVGDLDQAASKKNKVSRTEILEREEQMVREEIRGLLSK